MTGPRAALPTIVFLTLLLPLQALRAEPFGLLHGRSAYPDAQSVVALESGFANGSNFMQYGARLTWRASSRLSLHADLVSASYDMPASQLAGPGYGLGVWYYLSRQPLAEHVDMALHASVHRAAMSDDSHAQDYRILTLDVLLSGIEPLAFNGLGWYASAGGSRLAAAEEARHDMLWSAGLYLPFGHGDLHAGIEYFNGTGFGFGYRFLF